MFSWAGVPCSGSPPLPRSSPPLPRSSPPLPRLSPPLPRSSPPLPRLSPPLPRSSPPLPRSSPSPCKWPGIRPSHILSAYVAYMILNLISSSEGAPALAVPPEIASFRSSARSMFGFGLSAAYVASGRQRIIARINNK
ncbi:hypothetical protein X546_00495 [Brevibacillus borstelensis cifa_chp40]|nr:hypothetical protein X546_00495 [Brevibacillus borstelensis cifa_chp40]